MTGDDRSATTTYRKLGHVPALDGLRAVAIAAVIAFHFPTRSVVKGGLFGVDVFFALSGFLVTALLLGEFGQSGRIRLRAFLARRGWRLVPALFAFLGLYLAADAVFGRTSWFASNPFSNQAPGRPVSLGLAAKGAAGVATYSFNLFRAHRVVLPPIGHLWSLSIEGQFYLIFPVAVVLVMRRNKLWLLPLTCVAAATSAVLPWLLWHGGAGANLIYYGTGSRVQGLLIGSVGAQLWSLGLVARVPVRIRRCLAVIAAGVIAYLFFGVGNTTFKYLGALTVAAVAATIIVVHLAEPASPGLGRRLLTLRPVVWLGQRSYAVYLWHYVFDCWTNLLPHWIGMPIAIAASLVAAELSWRLVEAPAQRFARRRRQRHADRVPANPATPAGDEVVTAVTTSSR